MIVQYFCRLLKFESCLPRSFKTRITLAMLTLTGTILLLWMWRSDPSGSRLLAVEQGVQLWLCGLLWIVCTLAVSRGESGRTLDVMKGFLALYSIGLITASLRVFVPLTFVTLWGIDLLSQLAIVGWWIRTISNSAQCGANRTNN